MGWLFSVFGLLAGMQLLIGEFTATALGLLLAIVAVLPNVLYLLGIVPELGGTAGALVWTAVAVGLAGAAALRYDLKLWIGSGDVSAAYLPG